MGRVVEGLRGRAVGLLAVAALLTGVVEGLAPGLYPPFHLGVLLAEDQTRILSILMPCTITVYKKDNGKTYIGMMNAGLMGKMFGSTVARVMGEVAKDQKQMVTFDPSKPAPPLIRTRPGGGGGAGGKDTSGC